MPYGFEPGVKVYRCEAHGQCVDYYEFTVARLTPQGFWYRSGKPWGKDRWASYATHSVSLSRQEALDSARRRKTRHLEHIERRYRRAVREWHALHEGVDASRPEASILRFRPGEGLDD